jgi:hypothetical protein
MWVVTHFRLHVLLEPPVEVMRDRERRLRAKYRLLLRNNHEVDGGIGGRHGDRSIKRSMPFVEVHQFLTLGLVGASELEGEAHFLIHRWATGGDASVADTFYRDVSAHQVYFLLTRHPLYHVDGTGSQA